MSKKRVNKIHFMNIKTLLSRTKGSEQAETNATGSDKNIITIYSVCVCDYIYIYIYIYMYMCVCVCVCVHLFFHCRSKETKK